MMMSIEKLVARLRERQERIHDLSGVSYIDDPDCQKAADKLEELSAQVERCHEWLEARDAIIKEQDEELFALRKWRQEYVGKLTIAEAALAEAKREIEALRKSANDWSMEADKYKRALDRCLARNAGGKDVG